MSLWVDTLQALKNFLEVIKHFAVFKEDQFDFHSYCVRKMTLRNYISMLRMEDEILQNEYYAKVSHPSFPPSPFSQIQACQMKGKVLKAWI